MALPTSRCRPAQNNPTQPFCYRHATQKHGRARSKETSMPGRTPQCLGARSAAPGGAQAPGAFRPCRRSGWPTRFEGHSAWADG
jgi:hypothetical protein